MAGTSPHGNKGVNLLIVGALVACLVSGGADEPSPPPTVAPTAEGLPAPTPPPSAPPAPAPSFPFSSPMPALPAPVSPAPATTSPASAPAAEPAPEEAGEVALLARLRRQFGDPLAESSLGASSTSDFAAALSALNAEPFVRPTSVDAATSPVHPPVPHVATRPVPSAGEVAALRTSARQLERTAATLEDLGRYDEADRLRAMAGELRWAARQVDVAAEHAARSVIRQALSQPE